MPGVQDFGDIQEFYTQKLPSEGFCVVSYFDIRDSITAYRKLQTEHPIAVQFCSSGYVTMVSSVCYIRPGFITDTATARDGQ